MAQRVRAPGSSGTASNDRNHGHHRGNSDVSDSTDHSSLGGTSNSHERSNRNGAAPFARPDRELATPSSCRADACVAPGARIGRWPPTAVVLKPHITPKHFT